MSQGIFRAAGVCRSGWRLALVAALAAAALGVPASAATPPDLGGGSGTVVHHPYGTVDGLPFDYYVYLPVGWKTSDRLPLVVMAHGCGSPGAALEFMDTSLMNPIADRERFIVMYPDNGGGCWRPVSDDAILTKAGGVVDMKNVTRGAGGDVDIVANMTKQVIGADKVDAGRVYMIGMSAGGFLTSAMGAAYPDLFAAVGVASGAGPGMAVTCVGYPSALVPQYAQYAVAAMGSRAHVMPTFVISGDVQDWLGSASDVNGCARLAYLEWVAIDNLLNPKVGPLPVGTSVLIPPVAQSGVENVLGSRLERYEDDPRSTRQGQVPNGHSWTETITRDPAGCEIAEQWVVHAMSHNWSGGRAQNPNGNDPLGPNASQLSWDFLRNYTMKRGNTVCRH